MSEVQDFIAHCQPELRDDVERLFSFVQSTNEKGCWLWRDGKPDKVTYPSFWLGSRPDRKMIRPHRLVLIAKGHDMEGLVGRHKCDNKRCVNPDHLIPGTHLDNHRDAVERGLSVNPPQVDWRSRMSKAAHHWQKLQKDQIPLIRIRLANGETGASIASDYGVSTDCIGKIKRNERWSHVQ